ncbi:MAG: hypothetical protein LBH12_05430 [Dysgonamonadaceae bacterium]|jgi:hypothetical protein|nr:hypothetical protein [Dysgonamonadaceae bacterium]
MKIKITGIRRGNQYSPNHIGNDAAIFNLTTEYLKTKNCEITEYTEEEFRQATVEADLIFNMVRNTQSIKKLQQLEDKGIKIVNSGYGIENCTREKMTRLLLSNNIPHPTSIIVRTDNPNLKNLESLESSYCWIKRGDFHAIHREDVTYARMGEEAESIIKEYYRRGIPSAVINEHLDGDLVKFYGVDGEDFFYWFYPNDLNHSKFGLERINGKSKGIPFDLNELKKICSRSAQVLDIRIYGGDCVVDKNGNIKIIDFNDWPSFAPCRNEAAPHIAQCIYKIATGKN